MHYTNFVTDSLHQLGFAVVPQFNCFQPPYDPASGWPLKLPDVEFGPRTILVLHFQDFVTPGDSITELVKVEQHYKDRANQVVVLHWSSDLGDHYQGPLNLIEFSSHNILTVTSIQNCRDQWIGEFQQPKDINWMCLNGRTCPHRARAAEILKQFDNGVVSYGAEYPLRDWPYSTYKGTDNDENFVRLARLYAKTKVNIVTETQYDARPGIVTEKTIMAAVAKQIPIVIGHPGIVKDCKKLGFDMFEDLVDTSYDWLPNDIRVQQAIEKNKDLIVHGVDTDKIQARLDAQSHWVLHVFEEQIKRKFLLQASALAEKFQI